jgi:glycerophosphoryl diester phosphodiesterase
MFANLPKPAIFAHRGASALAPENTLAAFQLAVDLGAHAIELDAKLTLDGEVVVFHDRSLARTTGAGGMVGETSLDALRELDAGSFFASAFHGEKIPTLDEVFAQVGGKIYVNVELTNYANPNDELPEKVAELVRRYNLEEQVLFSSFNPSALNRIKKLLPKAPLGFLALPGRPGMLARSWFGGLMVPYLALHPEAGDVSRKLIERLHRRGARVHTYTVNDPDQMRQFFQMGVDGIFTDDPGLGLKVLGETRAAGSPEE